jgi:hypothetical protein
VIVLAAISWSVLNRVQEPVDRAFATPPYTRDYKLPELLRKMVVVHFVTTVIVITDRTSKSGPN